VRHTTMGRDSFLCRLLLFPFRPPRISIIAIRFTCRYEASSSLLSTAPPDAAGRRDGEGVATEIVV